MENYINGYSVGVGSGGIDNVSTTLPVYLAASVSGGFRILVDNGKMLVTAGGTTTSWTVTRAIEGSAAASHAVAAAIYIVITAGSLDQIRQDMVGYGSSLPGSPKNGDTFILTTNGVQYLYTSGTWQPIAYQYAGNIIDTPPLSPTAWDDEFLGSSLDLTKWTIYDPFAWTSYLVQAMSNSWFTMNVTNHGAGNRIIGFMQNTPSGNWKFRTKFAIDCATWQYFGMGIFCRNSANDHTVQGMQTYFSGQTGTYWFERNVSGNVSTDTECYNNAASPQYMEVEYDGTYLYYRCSTSGAYYVPFFTEAISSHLGAPPTQIGIMLMPYGDGSSNPAIGLCGSWDWFRRIA